jgi:hypothetical protein
MEEALFEDTEECYEAGDWSWAAFGEENLWKRSESARF